MTGISVWQIIIILLIGLLLFGSSRLRSLRKETGLAVKGFRQLLAGQKNADGSQTRKSGN
ncbi:twin-arginine translocase TatA/TatE family subunit [Bowmanella dokdonensis]|uniref:Twin-arginine translocase TatA/TatE family subunit n=1 Tax=Bowmanella dokdonensis TaxID=751969 RepID=A0A939IPN3_9ALTE|nr:twin-arginine translocase TatA/TatE family subunit [Bowmanella dokdonensis]MBN7827623.1 twin-arginine translocase TatA/TatE family subunit [Bowmanella dokdonensis]